MLNYETKEQKENKLKRQNLFNKMKELNKKKLSLKNISYKSKNKNIDDLTKSQRTFINKKIDDNIKRENIKSSLDPEFINVSSLKPEDKILIKDNIDNIYNEGDIMSKDIINNEFIKIDELFKKNLLTLMTLKDFDIVNNEFNKNYTLKKFVNVNFPDLVKQLKEKYTNLDVKEFILFLKEYYKDPKKLSIRETINKKFSDIKKNIDDNITKVRRKLIKHTGKKEKEEKYNVILGKLEQLEEKIEDKKENIKEDDIFEKELEIAENMIKEMEDKISISNINEKRGDIMEEEYMEIKPFEGKKKKI